MKLEKFKERDNKRIGIIVFTIVCIMLVSGVILYRTFAIFEVKINQNIINGEVQSMGDLEFAFYKDNEIVKDAPKKSDGYSLDTSSSYCIDMLNNEKISNVNWNYENWSVEIKNVSTTKTKCFLYFKQIYKEEILNGAIPDLGNGRLIPVQIKEEQPTEITIQNMDGTYGGKVVKADITSKWYSYTDKQWANAVILKDGKIDDYAPGDEIKESDIESYFVWIPRYRYQLFSENLNQYSLSDLGNIDSSKSEDIAKIPSNVPNIQIVFETKEKNVTQGVKKGDWLTHPAFTSFNSNGLWVGKFETGYKEAIDEAGARKNTKEENKVIIKPNVYSWRSLQIGNAFYNSYDYKRELESHLIKNTEWGAVAYLASSKYGLCDEATCENIMLNNNISYITGYSSKTQPVCGYIGVSEACNNYERAPINTNGNNTYNYFDTRSKVASTTQNYSGIYDMSGGAWEVTMGVMQNSAESSIPATGLNQTSNSGFNGPYSNADGKKEDGFLWPSKKYYDLYDYDTSINTYNRGILGDATKEIETFFAIHYYSVTSGSYNHQNYYSSYQTDSAQFVRNIQPWFVRGGHWNYGSGSGIMAFGMSDGNLDSGHGFRIVLAP